MYAQKINESNVKTVPHKFFEESHTRTGTRFAFSLTLYFPDSPIGFAE
jgi:hypothetical protein